MCSESCHLACFIYAGLLTCAGRCGVQRLKLVTSSFALAYFLRQDFPLNLELTVWVRLTGQQAPSISIYLLQPSRDRNEVLGWVGFCAVSIYFTNWAVFPAHLLESLAKSFDFLFVYRWSLGIPFMSLTVLFQGQLRFVRSWDDLLLGESWGSWGSLLFGESLRVGSI